MDSFFAAVSENVPLIFLDIPFLVGSLSSFLTGVVATCLIIFSRQNREQKKKKHMPRSEAGYLVVPEDSEDYALCYGSWDADYDCRNDPPSWDKIPHSVRSLSPILGPLTAPRTKIVKFRTPILDSDLLYVELKINGEWMTSGYTVLNGQQYGTVVDTLNQENKKKNIVRVRFLESNVDLKTKQITPWKDGWWRVVKKTKPAGPWVKIHDESCSAEMEAASAVNLPDAKDHKYSQSSWAEIESNNGRIPVSFHAEQPKSDPLEFTLRQSLMFWNYTWSETDPLVEVTLDEAIDDFKAVLEFYKSVMVCTQTISRPTVAKWFKESELYSRRLDENGKMKTFVQIKEFVTAGPETDAAPFVMHWPFSNTI